MKASEIFLMNVEKNMKTDNKVFLMAAVLMAAALMGSCSNCGSRDGGTAVTDGCAYVCSCAGECSAGHSDKCGCHAAEGTVRHVILWTLSDELSAEQKAEVIATAEAAMKKFENEIPGLVKADVIYEGRLESSNCDFMFDMYFASRQALEDFSMNPEHLAVVAQLKPSITGRTCLDVGL